MTLEWFWFWLKVLGVLTAGWVVLVLVGVLLLAFGPTRKGERDLLSREDWD